MVNAPFKLFPLKDSPIPLKNSEILEPIFSTNPQSFLRRSTNPWNPGAISFSFKAPINFLIGGINALIKGINKIKFDVPDWVPGIGGKQFGFNIPQIPKLAKGTILNAPGRGVPVAGGRALAGEAGREAYLPLSDTQLLEELGSTIGKYITINANITNTMNGRIISRQLQKIQNDSNFAYNS